MSTQFTTPARLEMLDDFKWKLLESFKYHVGSYPSSDVIVVPAGFITDLASVPRVLWNIFPPHGEYAKAAIIHDYLYHNHINNRSYADSVLLEAMGVLGVAKWRKYSIYIAVRLFGWLVYNKEKVTK